MAVASGGWKEGLSECILLLQLNANTWEIARFKLIMKFSRTGKQARDLFAQAILASMF